jgi:hypothetical protein
MKKSVLNDLRLESRPKMWQNFDTESIVHEEFVPPGQTVNGKFYCDVLRQLSEVIQHNVQTSGATTPGVCIMTTLRITCRLLCSSFWLLRIRQSSPTLPTHRTLPPVIFSCFQRSYWSSRGKVLTNWRDQDRIAGRDDDTDTKWLPAVLPIMKILLGSLYQCRRGLLRRGWGRIGISGTTG